MQKQNKDIKISVRMTETQFKHIQHMIDSGQAKNQNQAIQMLINKAILFG